MAETTSVARQKVVNLSDYRAARAGQERPLFDTRKDASLAPAPAPARALLPRQVEHRARMLRHLASG
jgi:hypothetical protein